MITTTDAYPEWFVDRENLSLLPTPSPSGSEAVISPSEGSLEGNSIQIGTLIAIALGLIAIAAIIGAGWCFVVRSQEAAKLKQELEESRPVSVSLSKQNSKIINERRDSNFVNESSIRSCIGLTKRAVRQKHTALHFLVANKPITYVEGIIRWQMFTAAYSHKCSWCDDKFV